MLSVQAICTFIHFVCVCNKIEFNFFSFGIHNTAELDTESGLDMNVSGALYDACPS